MLLPRLLTLAGASAPAAHDPPTFALLADALPNGSVGAQPVDAIFALGTLAVLGFAGRQVFDSLFPENKEYVPPLPGWRKSH